MAIAELEYRPGKLFVYDDGRRAEGFSGLCAELAMRCGWCIITKPELAHLAIGPCVERRLAYSEFSAPAHGTLIFHPSLLPYRRGPDSIAWTIADGERVSAITWFWCDDGPWDSGDICEQEPVLLVPRESARDAYARRFIPAGLRALERVLFGVAIGRPRRAPQEHSLATYCGKFQAS